MLGEWQRGIVPLPVKYSWAELLLEIQWDGEESNIREKEMKYLRCRKLAAVGINVMGKQGTCTWLQDTKWVNLLQGVEGKLPLSLASEGWHMQEGRICTVAFDPAATNWMSVNAQGPLLCSIRLHSPTKPTETCLEDNCVNWKEWDGSYPGCLQRLTFYRQLCPPNMTGRWMPVCSVNKCLQRAEDLLFPLLCETGHYMHCFSKEKNNLH